jgi:hypothetical protein
MKNLPVCLLISLALACALIPAPPLHAADTTEAPPPVEAPGAEEAKQALAEPAPAPPPPAAQVGRGGLLIGAGQHELELRLSYGHFSSNAIFIDGVAILPVIVVGEIALERIRRDILIGTWAWRLGLTNNTQIELRVPYRYQHDRQSIPEATPPIERTNDDHGLGDISAAIFHQLPGKPLGQDLIVGFEAKSRTGRDIFDTTRLETVADTPVVVQRGLPMGTGFWSFRGIVTGVRTSDPAVLFWNLGYTRNISRDDVTVFNVDPETEEVISTVVKVVPGSTYEYGLGLAYALNPDLSISLQFQQAITQSTKIKSPAEGSAWVAGSSLNVASIRLGAAWPDANGDPTDVSVSFGLTEDSPDIIVEVRKVF